MTEHTLNKDIGQHILLNVATVPILLRLRLVCKEFQKLADDRLRQIFLHSLMGADPQCPDFYKWWCAVFNGQFTRKTEEIINILEIYGLKHISDTNRYSYMGIRQAPLFLGIMFIFKRVGYGYENGLLWYKHHYKEYYTYISEHVTMTCYHNTLDFLKLTVNDLRSIKTKTRFEEVCEYCLSICIGLNNKKLETYLDDVLRELRICEHASSSRTKNSKKNRKR